MHELVVFNNNSNNNKKIFINKNETNLKHKSRFKKFEQKKIEIPQFLFCINLKRSKIKSKKALQSLPKKYLNYFGNASWRCTIKEKKQVQKDLVCG